MAPHPVLATVEILRMIFEFCDKRTLRRCVSVSHQWSEISLEVLWYEVDDPRRLFGLLHPSWKTSPSTHLRTSILPQARDVFLSYARRIRKLRFKNEPHNWKQVLYLTNCIVASGHFLPRLTTLEWVPSADMFLEGLTDASIVLMAPSLTELIIGTQNNSSTRIQPSVWEGYIDAMKVRLPALEKLEIRINSLFDEGFESASWQAILDMASAIPTLQSLVLPMLPEYDLSIFPQLGVLPSLKKLRFEPLHLDCGFMDFSNESYSTHTICLGAFSMLEVMDIHVSYGVMIDVFSSRNPIPTLTSFKLSSDTIECADDIKEVVSALVAIAPSIKKVALGHRLNFDVHQDDDPETCRYQTVHATDFDPLLSCTLVEFTFQHRRPLQVGSNDIARFASAWPSIEVLALNHTPPEGSPLLPLAALLPLAKLCPRLVDLRLPLCAHSGDVPLASNDWSSWATTYTPLPQSEIFIPFKRLEALTVPILAVHNTNSVVARFLSRLLPPRCRIYGQMAPSLIQEYARTELSINTLLMPLREQENEMARMRREIQDLKSRLGLP
ncbi:hypothetical protein HGRIS_001667 [Hohenbuehelia grisea]|uniref:F-box domain-containing protein n=1 Tax=Hohenbuehelia grisea TaxID=104357 RepID=A0ABR3JJU7_9AGAR